MAPKLFSDYETPKSFEVILFTVTILAWILFQMLSDTWNRWLKSSGYSHAKFKRNENCSILNINCITNHVQLVNISIITYFIPGTISIARWSYGTNNIIQIDQKYQFNEKKRVITLTYDYLLIVWLWNFCATIILISECCSSKFILYSYLILYLQRKMISCYKK